MESSRAPRNDAQRRKLFYLTKRGRMMETTAKKSLSENLVFTSNWISARTKNWEEALSHLKGKPNIKGLEIGVYEGRSLAWWYENILTGENNSMFAVEPWREKFEPNLKRFRDHGYDQSKLDVAFTTGQKALMSYATNEQYPFDFAYIDGGKDADTVLQNSILTWLQLKPGGIIIWDDYEWKWTEGSIIPEEIPLLPKVGIDAFLSAHEGKYEELHRDWQIIIKKK